jgi:hypothetical protein
LLPYYNFIVPVPTLIVSPIFTPELPSSLPDIEQVADTCYKTTPLGTVTVKLNVYSKVEVRVVF